MSFFSDEEKAQRRVRKSQDRTVEVRLNGNVVYAMFNHSGTEIHDPQLAAEVVTDEGIRRLYPEDVLCQQTTIVGPAYPETARNHDQAT